jgi:hypothetical protein
VRFFKHKITGKDFFVMENESLIARFEQALVSLDRVEAKDILLAAGDRWSPIEIVEMIVVPALDNLPDCQPFRSFFFIGLAPFSPFFVPGRPFKAISSAEQAEHGFLISQDPSEQSHTPPAFLFLKYLRTRYHPASPTIRRITISSIIFYPPFHIGTS